MGIFKHVTLETKRTICDLFKEGISINEIVDLTKTSNGTVYNALYKAGLKERTLRRFRRRKKAIKKQISITSEIPKVSELVKLVMEFEQAHNRLMAALKKRA